MTLAESATLQPYRRLLTSADLATLPSTRPSGPVRYELYEGELRIMPPTAGGHGKSEGRIGGVLAMLGDFEGHGEVLCGEIG